MPLARQLSSVKTPTLDEVSELAFRKSSLDLAAILKACAFPDLDRRFRGDTRASPHPHHWAELCEAVNARLSTIDPNEVVRYGFLKMGEAYQREMLDHAFGPAVHEFLVTGIASGLCQESAEGISLGGFVCVAFNLPSGEPVFCLADLPSNAAPPNPPRVYAGVDSYLLIYRLLQADPIHEPIVELGSGAAIQSIALLKAWPECPIAVGIEVDDRARIASRRSAIMNGVEDRFVVVATPEEAVAVLKGRRARLVFGNPPHYALPVAIGVGNRVIPTRDVFGCLGDGGENGTEVVVSLINALQPVFDECSEVILLGDYPGPRKDPAGVANLGRAIGMFEKRFVPAFERRDAFLITRLEHAARTAELLVDSLGQTVPDGLNPIDLAQDILRHWSERGLGPFFHYGFAEFLVNSLRPWSCPQKADNGDLLNQLGSSQIGFE